MKLVTKLSEYILGVKPFNREKTMKTLNMITALSLVCSFASFAKPKVIDLKVEGEKTVDLDTVTCKQAYEKARGKKHHKRLFHVASTKNRAAKKLNVDVSKDDVERAIEYGYRTGAYCKSGKLLSVKEFKQVTITQIEALKAADKLGTKLESLETGDNVMRCRDLVKMPKTNKEDGLNRHASLILKKDIHNIYSAYEKEQNGVELKSKEEMKLEKAKDKYLRRVQRKAVDELDDDSISMADVKKAFDDSIEDGSVCAGDKVMNRSQMKELLVHRLSDQSARAENVNSEVSELERDIQIYFNNGGRVEDQNVEVIDHGVSSDA